MTKQAYRPDIDGLRTVAVLPVILFHGGVLSIAGVPIAPGGYVGVDIFFVISGFLISKIIYRDINNQKYSIIDFYARRIKRIFPALFVIYIICLVMSVAFSVLDEAQQIRNAVVSSIFFISNVYFANHAGYFDNALQNNPLLHTWSLSIEEQFYVIFPLILLMLRRLSHRQRVSILVVLTVVSIGYSYYITKASPDLSYYSIFTRAWELAIGSLLAITRFRRPPDLVREILSISGFSAILTSILFYNSKTEFPGIAALLPTLGAAAIIYSGTEGKTRISQLLSWQPIRFIGLISYSLYLWHWPLLVFGRQLGFQGHLSVFVIFVLCFAISFVSWRFVEQPFRISSTRAQNKKFVLGGICTMVVTSTLALMSVPLNNLVIPVTAQGKMIAAFVNNTPQAFMRQGTCFITSKESSFSAYRKDICLREEKDKPNALIIGDSHSAQFYEPFRRVFPEYNIMQASASGCLPYFGTHGEQRCLELWDYITRKYLPEKKPEAIILIGRWTKESVIPVFATAKTLLKYTPHVYIIGPNPSYTVSLPKVLYRAAALNEPALVDSYIDYTPNDVDQAFRAHDPHLDGVTFISYFSQMCPHRCPTFTSHKEPLLLDDNHLSLSAGLDFVDVIRREKLVWLSSRSG